MIIVYTQVSRSTNCISLRKNTGRTFPTPSHSTLNFFWYRTPLIFVPLNNVTFVASFETVFYICGNQLSHSLKSLQLSRTNFNPTYNQILFAFLMTFPKRNTLHLWFVLNYSNWVSYRFHPFIQIEQAPKTYTKNQPLISDFRHL